MADRLSDAEREQALLELPGWRDRDGTIARDFRFADFVDAFGFMTRVALLVQQADHHPDWSNSYDKVSIALSTHDAGGVTAKDVELASKINKLAD